MLNFDTNHNIVKILLGRRRIGGDNRLGHIQMPGLFQIGNQGLRTGGPRLFGSVAAVRWLLSVVSVAGAVILASVLEPYWQFSTGEIFWSEETFCIFQYVATSKP
jgi:hypothetical protein